MTSNAEASAECPFYSIDMTEWPVVVVSLNRPPTQDAEIDTFQVAFINMLRAVCAGCDGTPRDRICLLMVMDGIMGATLSQQFRAASFIEDVRELVEPAIFCTALVVKNEIVRMILNIILRLKPLKSLHRVFSTVASAAEWSHVNADRQSRGQLPIHEDDDVAE
jgi:hypothetical protein